MPFFSAKVFAMSLVCFTMILFAENTSFSLLSFGRDINNMPEHQFAILKRAVSDTKKVIPHSMVFLLPSQLHQHGCRF